MSHMHIVLTSILLITSILPNFLYAQDADTGEQMITGIGENTANNFVAEEIDATVEQTLSSNDMYLSNSDISAFNVDEAVNRMQKLQSSVDSLTQQLYYLDAEEMGKNEELSDAYMQTRDQVVRVINDISASVKDVDQLLRKVAIYQRQVIAGTEQLKYLRNEIDTSKQAMQSLSNLLYKASNEIYSPSENILDEVKLLIYSDNIARTISQEQAVSSLLQKFNILIEELYTQEQRTAESIRAINQMKNKASAAISIYGDELDKMEQKRNYLVQFLDLYQDKQVDFNDSINQIFSNRMSVHNAIHTLLKDIQVRQYNVSFDVDIALSAVADMNNNNSDHPLAWPLYPIDDIAMFFGDSTFTDEYGIPHEGMQVTTSQGSAVYAARDGVVYHVTNEEDIGINWLLILHTEGYASVYIFMSDILVEPGQIVQRGELIGYSGGEPGTKGAGFVAPGPNLSFNVYRDGVAIDPLKVLDISVVRNKNILSDTYTIKYLRDKYARTIDVSGLKTIDGATDAERAQNFLYGYAVGAYRQLSFWNDAVAGTNIDRDMLICVAFAESTLGKYLSTNNNIGNVGNNDRGDRFAFGNALAGARAIAHTLNNQHLGHYHTINQLSRYGNSDGKIYASSPINWQTNVLKCLSQIKGYYIPEDFPFRTGPNPNIIEDTTVKKEGFDRVQVRVGQ